MAQERKDLYLKREGKSTQMIKFTIVTRDGISLFCVCALRVLRAASSWLKGGLRGVVLSLFRHLSEF